MIVAVDPERGIGAVRYSGGEEISDDDVEEWFSVGGQAKSNGTVAYSYFGTGHEWPDNSDVSLDLVKQAMAELLKTGGQRPTNLTWQGRD
ncbi:MAG: Imm1 family immunity protein [Actinomycetota bacterium]|nr:Imm1 family immunity protein [Actinomycetota bacterium]